MLFTGEASLYRSNHWYAGSAANADSQAGRRLVPQLRGMPATAGLSELLRLRGGDTDVCACLQVCDARGVCTGCACDPPGCGSC
jgi:hypothetical protein